MERGLANGQRAVAPVQIGVVLVLVARLVAVDGDTGGLGAWVPEIIGGRG